MVRARLTAGCDLRKASAVKFFTCTKAHDLPARLKDFDQVFHIVSHKRGSRSEINRAPRIGYAVITQLGPAESCEVLLRRPC